MATSESDADFESADEELGRGAPVKRATRVTVYRTTVDSESDDDTEYVQRMPCDSADWQRRSETFRMTPDVLTGRKTLVDDKDDKIDSDVKVESGVRPTKSVGRVEETSNKQETASSIESEISTRSSSTSTISAQSEDTESVIESCKTVEANAMSKVEATKTELGDKEISQAKQRQGASFRQLDAKKLGTRLTKANVGEPCVTSSAAAEQEDKYSAKYSNEKSLPFVSKDMECKSEEKLKTQVTEVFQPEGWEGLGDDVELPDELTEEKLQPVLQRLSLANKEESNDESSLGSWGNWGNWGVTSLINTATASVSTLTSHVSQGFTLLEGIGAQDPTELERIKQDTVTATDGAQSEIQEQESRSYGSFGFGNLISGVSSITKLVESTGSKVMTGGLDTLEAIGKKTMEVLQDGDPGLKKKRAFFMNEPGKPNLSQILREAKEKAETEEKTIEERELARKVHFESLFDDYQGLVHLEALEMLSKQSNMKIQQHLIELDTNDLTSVQETLEEIKELCDLGDEDDENKDDKDLKRRLENACHDLGVDITYEKLYDVWTETENYLASSSTYTDQEIFQNAISTLAQFTAFSVERFHKTAELLLIKERRSTVNEADALVQLTNILSNHISLLANSFCDTLHQFAETAEKSDNINANITTIFLEAANANSYIQDAFRLLIPILQVGAI
ncbi:PREDICTED: protein FAM114A2 isoform X2 [Wasmannia auropunctata]|uniref:protein FAM114A2 isoform X2 n=1 Tax=Wasmannia auropunctata TaxID=64793 RepID=UPI0005EE6AE7|nr:PREDICTED: protein FAM114A2 isoform X2 [Wasmannia auropunctata]